MHFATLFFAAMTASEWLSMNWWDVIVALWPLVAFLLVGATGAAAWATTVLLYLKRGNDNDKKIMALILHHKHKPLAEDGTGGEVVFDAASIDVDALLGGVPALSA